MRGDELDKMIAELITVIDPTIVVYNSRWVDSIPEWLVERIRLRRIEEFNKKLLGEKITEASDEEVFAYLYTASLTHPLDTTWVRIYIYLGHKVVGDRLKNVLPEIELHPYEKEKLRRLKKRIYELRLRREKERVKELVDR